MKKGFVNSLIAWIYETSLFKMTNIKEVKVIGIKNKSLSDAIEKIIKE